VSGCEILIFSETNSENNKRARKTLPKIVKNLRVDIDNDAGTNGTAAFTNSKTETLFDSDGGDEFNGHIYVVTGTAHFYAFGKTDSTGNVSSSEVELRSVTCEEGLLTATFFFGKNVNLTNELGVGLDGAGLAENLTSFDSLLVDTTEKETYVVTSFSGVEELTEHFNTGDNGGLLFFGKTNDFNGITHLNDTTFYTTGSNSTTTGDGEYVFYRHEEGFVSLTSGSGNVIVNSCHEFEDGSVFGICCVGGSGFESVTSGTAYDRNIIAREVIFGEEFSDFHFNEFEKFVVVNEVALVHVNNDCGNANLTSEKDVFTGLLHRTVGSSNYEDRAVHLSSAGDHVLNVVSVAGTVNVCIVTCVGFVFNVSGVDCDTTSLFFGSVVDLVVCHEFNVTVCETESLGDSSGGGSLTVVNVTDSTNVYMGLGTLEMCLCHLD